MSGFSESLPGTCSTVFGPLSHISGVTAMSFGRPAASFDLITSASEATLTSTALIAIVVAL
jgi:hypothetical protein